MLHTPAAEAIPSVWIVTDEVTGRYLYTEEQTHDGGTVKVGPHFFFLKPDRSSEFYTEEVMGHDLLSGILTGFPPISSDAFCLNGRLIPLNRCGAHWVDTIDPQDEWETRFGLGVEDGMSHVLEVVSVELQVATIFTQQRSEENLLFRGFRDGRILGNAHRSSNEEGPSAVTDDPTVWILVHEDYSYPLFYRPGPSLTIGPYVFTHEREAVAAALDFPSDIVVARPGQTSRLLAELESDLDFTDGIILNPKMEDGFTLYEGIIPVTSAGAAFTDALVGSDFWGCLDGVTLRRFAFEILRKKTGMEQMD